MDNLQQQVQRAIDGLVESGTERGLQVAVYRDGEQVVDAVAGVADPETGRPVASDTPFYAYSVGKGATSAVAHVLVERGLFGYDTPIVELWPEFGAHGKESATVRHALTHTVGVPGIPADTTPEDLCDWDRMCAAIADSEPWWEPGTKTAYHAYPFGYIVGEIVRRATGKPISQVLQGGRGRAARRRRRALLRDAGVRARQAGPAGGHGGQRGVSRLDAGRFAVLQAGAAGDYPDRRVRQPQGHTHGRHPGRRQDLGAGHGPHVRRADGRGGRRAARLARTAARDLRRRRSAVRTRSWATP